MKAAMDLQPTWLQVFRALGINIAILADFHGGRASERYRQASLRTNRRSTSMAAPFSDRDFLLIPGEEPDANFGGHYMFVFPRPRVLHASAEAGATTEASLSPKTWTLRQGVPHHDGRERTRTAQEREGSGVADASATKGSAGYPDATKDTDFFRSDRFLGWFYQSLPVDQSEKRLCEKRCLGLLDDMNNWTGPKYMIAEGDTYMKYPG